LKKLTDIPPSGRRLRIPYEHCRTFDVNPFSPFSFNLTYTPPLTQPSAFLNPSLAETCIPIAWDCLDLTLDGCVIPGRIWESTIKPGITIEIRHPQTVYRSYSVRDPPLGSLPPGFGLPAPTPASRPTPPLPPMPMPRSGKDKGVLRWMANKKGMKGGKRSVSSSNSSSDESEEEGEWLGSEMKRLGLWRD